MATIFEALKITRANQMDSSKDFSFQVLLNSGFSLNPIFRCFSPSTPKPLQLVSLRLAWKSQAIYPIELISIVI
jgi:hypothetical protein